MLKIAYNTVKNYIFGELKIKEKYCKCFRILKIGFGRPAIYLVIGRYRFIVLGFLVHKELGCG